MPRNAKIYLPPDRYFDPDPAQKSIAGGLYDRVAQLPLICPHGHVEPRMFADPDYTLGTPAELFVIPDHYIFRMLYSQGIRLESLGIPGSDGGQVETDHRKIWQIFAENYHLFRGTPSGMWLNYELREVFGVEEKLTGSTAQAIYDHIDQRLQDKAFRPRALFERFNIEVLATTDAVTDPLTYHRAIRESGWKGRIIPTFRPDTVINIDTLGWDANIQLLSDICGITIKDYKSFVQALEDRRAFFKSMGATATDHAAMTAYTGKLTKQEADHIFQKALKGNCSADESMQFTGHMLMEMARMSTEDHLVMQLHIGSLRNHNTDLFRRFGRDKGADIPLQTEFTRNLHPLLNAFGNDANFHLILFTLDETTYSRELAPLAGHYPAVKLGPPWWFHDSWNGMRRFFDQVMETAGIYNTVGFNDDTRAFPSIPARHDVWRRAASDWLAGLIIRGIVDLDDGEDMIELLAYGLAKQSYNL